MNDPLSITEPDILAVGVTVLRTEGVGRGDLVVVLDAVPHFVGSGETEIVDDGVTEIDTSADRVVDGDAEYDVLPLLVRELEFDPVAVFVPVCDVDVVVDAVWLRETVVDAVTVGLTRIVVEILAATVTAGDVVEEVEKEKVGDIEVERREVLVNDELPEFDLDIKTVADIRGLAVDGLDGNTDGDNRVVGVEALEKDDEPLSVAFAEGELVARIVFVPIREGTIVFETAADLVLDDDILGDDENEGGCELERETTGDFDEAGDNERDELAETERETIGDAVITIVAAFVLEIDALPETVLVPEGEAVIVFERSGDFVVLADGLKVGVGFGEDECFPDLLVVVEALGDLVSAFIAVKIPDAEGLPERETLAVAGFVARTDNVLRLVAEAVRDTKGDREAVMVRVVVEEVVAVMVADDVRDRDFVDEEEAVIVADFVLVLLAVGDLLVVADRVFVRVDDAVFVDVDVATMAASAISRATSAPPASVTRSAFSSRATSAPPASVTRSAFKTLTLLLLSLLAARNAL